MKPCQVITLLGWKVVSVSFKVSPSGHENILKILQKNLIINAMTEIMQIIKNSEKILLWLYREDKTMTWLSLELGQTKQAVSQKIKTNSFSDWDLTRIKRLGCPL
jgi:hypothetical protein